MPISPQSAIDGLAASLLPHMALPGLDTGVSARATSQVIAGWPMSAFEGGTTEVRGGTVSAVSALILPGSPSQSTAFSPTRIIPFRPRPLGLAVDAVFYAAVILILARLLRIIVGALRPRASHDCCQSCGYPTVPSWRCPECGSEGSAARAGTA